MVRKIIGILLFVLFSAHNIYAYNEKENFSKLITAIGHVESQGNTRLVSDCGKFIGYLQISKIVVDDCNRIIGKNKYRYEHRFDKKRSVEMFYIIQSYYNPDFDIEKAIRIWNGGPNYSMKKTQRYYNKVIKEFNRLNSI